jgi:serine phosphatase RsbU (regulator of sigma subunit)
LPKKEDIYASLKECFVLFKPKDIVSGDFYFFHKNKNSIFIVAADCTGHGVPGAFMSMMCSEKLDDAIAHSSNTSEILKHLNKGIKNSLHQSENSDSTKDGMDIAICSIDIEKRIVKYSGANRPLWIIRKDKMVIEEIKATKKAIGGFTDDDQNYNGHEFSLNIGDTIYISTDGYADQFGGQSGKKLMTKLFKEILLGIQDKPMCEQEKHLDNFVENWKNGMEQVDDILVIGVRL